MVRNTILAAALLLSGCERSVYAGWSSEKTAERADIADVNARNALARIAALEARADDLERKLREAESEIEAEPRIRQRVDQSLANSVDSLAEKHNLIVDRIYGPK